MENWVFAACAAAALIGALLLLLDHRQQQRMTLRVQKMRSSRFYEELSRALKPWRGHALDQVIIERDHIIVRGMQPPETLVSFSLSEHGLRYLTEQRLEALTVLLGEDIPNLRDSHKYRLRRYSVMRPNGEWDRAWEYTVRSAYKTYVLRTWQWRTAGVQAGERNM